MYLLPQYTHIVNPKLRHIYLSFDITGNLIIKSPKVSQKKIEELLLKKSSWIEKSRKKIKEKKGQVFDPWQTPELYFLGKPYTVNITSHQISKTKLFFTGKEFNLSYKTYNPKTVQKHIHTFYKQEAKKMIPPLVETWSKRMHLTYSKLSFRKTKRQWGSCSQKNDLSFNTMMMKLPQDVIQYIVIHELAHIQHKHHQKPFWHLVEHYMPTYKIAIRELKNYTT